MRITTATLSHGEALRIDVADDAWSRLRGLLGRDRLPAGEGLLLMGCASVHTCFMAFPVDVVYLDGDFRVTKTAERLQPWRFSFSRRGTRHTLELSAGAVEQHHLRVGDRLRVSP